MPLVARLVLLVVIAVLPALAIQLYNEYDLRQAREAQVRDEVVRDAHALADEIDGLVEGAHNVLATVAHAPTVRAGDWVSCLRFLPELSGINPAYSNIAVTDREGRVVCAREPYAVGGSLADRPQFNEIMATGGFVVGTFLIGHLSHTAILPVGLPFRDYRGHAAGAVVIGLRLDWLAQHLAQKPLPSTGLFLVADRAGTVLAQNADAEQWIGRKLPAPVQALLHAERAGSVEATWLGGPRRVLGFVPPAASSHGLFVVAALGADETLAPIKQATDRGVALVAVAGLVALIAAWIVGDRVIRRPIQQLIAATHDVRNGNYAAALPAGSAEFGALGGAFATMAAALAAREAALRQALERNQALLREAHHRIKNNLQLVSSLVGVQRAALRDAEARQALKEARRRIGAIARVHEGFYRTGEIGQVDFGEVLCALRDSLVSGADNQPEIRVEAPPPNVIPADTASPLALIANELVMNALKHAFPPGRRGTVTVRCATAPDGTITLTVADDGRGLPPGFAPGAQASFGLRLVQTLTRQIRGDVLVRHRHPGTVFEVRVPPAPAARA